MNDLQSKTALVTGGGSGVGACIAIALARAGVKVTIIGRSQAPLKSVSSQHEGINWVVADVTKIESIDAVVEATGDFDIVVANAGDATSKPFSAMQASDLQSMIDINLIGVFNTWKATLAGMKQKGAGRLLAIASTAGLKGYPYVSGYCAAKHGVIGLTRSLSLELAKTNITVNAICPSFVETPMLERSLENITKLTGRTREQAANALKAGNPQGRFIQPDEIAQTVLWLCSEQSESMNGQAISISGGEI
ncbi:MAG: 3-hydroxybutyrate dehydrogenase [Gammaproteobacteria bacterium]|jgi:NAD(P)-dependent dehydrogenase (short-subunit alcohol dehydrogenase family)